MTIMDSILSRMNIDQKINNSTSLLKPKNILDMINDEDYVGEVIHLEYDTAIIQIQDYFRNKVGGIPAQCFLLASRINKSFDETYFDKEDCSVILMRVINSANLPNDFDKQRLVAQNAQNSTTDDFWDSKDKLDSETKNIFSFGGLNCRVLGTFYMQDNKLCFGNDLSNFYPNRSLKVYKPNKDILNTIVNFGIQENKSVKIGSVRYSSTNRQNKHCDVYINPQDLIAQKSAVFGMTRTGKSNTVKTIAKAIYQLRQKTNQEIGQLILDVNGEYANDNIQDINDETGKASSLKNVWKIPVNGIMGNPDDIKTYGLLSHKNDPNRIIMKINFYDNTLLQTGKELIDDKLRLDPTNAQYVRHFINVSFQDLKDLNFGDKIREKRRQLVYKTILFKSGFKHLKIKQQSNIIQENEILFSDKLLKYLETGIHEFDSLSEQKQRDLDKQKKQYEDCAFILKKFNQQGSTFDELARAFKTLNEYMEDPNSNYHEFERQYTSSDDAAAWADVYLKSLLKVFEYENMFKKISQSNVYHDPNAKSKDYAHMIYEDLEQGKLVIIDQALGDSQLNKLASERILRLIFEKNNLQFSNAQTPSHILIYIEEAHNLMPKGSEEDTTNIWARVAKEGGKFNIGMIYSTQEVSSIQKNILKNTTNWFISHLNNKEEIKSLSDFYDFQDFSKSILQAEDQGFIRMKTRSNKFVVPIQVDKFQIENIE